MRKNITMAAVLVLAMFAIGCVSSPTGNVVVKNDSAMDMPGMDMPNDTAAPVDTGTAALDPPGAKVFYTDSFYVMENGKPHPQYSVKNMTVNRGDTVVVYVNTTNGNHDFNIDELGVKSETPTGKVTRIEFVADKAGDFTYYCSKPSHRANGHWGTLTVLDIS